MQDHVPYGGPHAITSLDNARWMIAIVSCGFWLPALIMGYLVEMWESRKGIRRPYWWRLHFLLRFRTTAG
jgi:hypothetical protein